MQDLFGAVSFAVDIYLRFQHLTCEVHMMPNIKPDHVFVIGTE